MNGELSARMATAATFVGKLWRLTIPYWRARDTAEITILGHALRVPERWIAGGLLAIVLFLNIVIVWILKLANDWNARFFNALEQKDVVAFWGELRYFLSSRRCLFWLPYIGCGFGRCCRSDGDDGSLIPTIASGCGTESTIAWS
jgi:hypothetical protein